MAAKDVVVILGGTGFIGRELVRQLRSKAKIIRVISRRASGFAPDEHGVEYISGSTRDRDFLSRVLTGATVVQHLAREDDFNFEEGARNIAEECLRKGVRRLIFASSTDALYLGDAGVIDETISSDPLSHLRNPYSRSKARVETLLLELHRTHGLPVVITRPALVVGRGGRVSHGGIGNWPVPTCCLGWGSGTNKLPFVLVQDVAAAHVLAMDAPDIDGSAFNLGGDVFLSAREYIELLAELSLRDFRFYPRNLRFYQATAAAKSLVKLVVRKHFERWPTMRNLRSAAMITRLDSSRAKKILNWSPNSDRGIFLREAILANLDPVAPGDLRQSSTVL